MTQCLYAFSNLCAHAKYISFKWEKWENEIKQNKSGEVCYIWNMFGTNNITLCVI